MVLRGWGARVCARSKSRTRAREPGGGSRPGLLSLGHHHCLPPLSLAARRSIRLPRTCRAPLVPYLPAGGVVAVAVVASTCCPPFARSGSRCLSVSRSLSRSLSLSTSLSTSLSLPPLCVPLPLLCATAARYSRVELYCEPTTAARAAVATPCK